MYALTRKNVFSDDLDTSISNDMLCDSVVITEVGSDKLSSEEVLISSKVEYDGDQTVTQHKNDKFNSFKKLEALVNS